MVFLMTHTDQIGVLLQNMLTALCDFPTESSVEYQKMIDGSGTFMIKVRQSDLGKVIGREGRMATAIRVIVSSLGASKGQRLHILIGS